MATGAQPVDQVQRAIDEWRRMASGAWEAQAALARESLERMTELSQSVPSAPGLDRAAVTAVTREYADFVNRAVGLSLGYADDMAALVQSTAARMLEDVQAGSRGAATSVQTIPMILRGHVGSTITSRVTLANHQAVTHDVTFEVGPVVGPRGSFAPSLRLEPAVLTLEPEQEAAVELHVELPAEHFDPGATYSCQVAVHGGDEAILSLTIQAEETSP